jgi:hypothetical protein
MYFIPFKYDLFLIYVLFILYFIVHDVWAKGKPQPADVKVDSLYDYYDIFEELGS